ncbi:RNA-binding protein NOB1, partial [Trichinella zimbabwensis]
YLYLSITFQIADVKLAAVFIICEFVSLTPRKWFFILANTMQVRYGHLLVFSLLLTAAVVLNAFHQRKQFYPSMVYLSKSNASVTHIADRAMFAVTETCLAFTIFRDDFSPRFVAQFTQLFFFKCFHWMAEERIDYMERSPVITTLFCARVMGLIAILSAVDSYHISHAYFTTLQKGATPQIVFGFEYAILLTVVFHIAVKYVLHRVDLRQPHPWENKAVYLLYFELVIVFLRVLLYAIFICVTMQLHTFPLFSIRPMYLALKTLKKAIMDAILSQRAIRNMNSLYPDVTAEDLSRGDLNMPAWFAGLPAGIIPPPAPGVGDGTPSSINPTVFAGFTGNAQAFPTPPDFTGLSDEEVRRMEGNERTAVEARIRCLRNIQTLLDGAVVLMQQYTSLMSAMDEKRTVNTEESEHKKETNSKTEEVNAKTVNIDELVEKPSTSAAAIAGTSSGDAQHELRQRRLQHYEKSTKAAVVKTIIIWILMTEMQLQVEHLVVDTVGFVKADDLRKYGKNIYTIQDVLNEIRDSNTRKKLSVLPYDLKTVIPDGKAIRFVTEFAKKTGDYPSLSVTDVKLIAAVYTMELEHVGSEHIIQEPKVQKTSSVGGQKCEEGKGLPGFYMPSKKKQSDCNDLEEAVRKIDIHDNSTSEEENSFSESDSEYEDEIRDTSNLSGWITPENFSSTIDSANDTVPVACLTADFAIQNVLLHMGLKVVSVDGMLIKQLKTYILRCFSCFHTTSKMMKTFCPNCGNATLKRLAISVDENGCTVFHFSRRKVISVRGSKFSIPAPKGGKHANNLILCEDQPVSQNRLSRKARQNLDVFDPDYIAGHSPFSLNDITSRSALLGIRAIHRPPRRNPNTYSLGRKRGGKKLIFKIKDLLLRSKVKNSAFQLITKIATSFVQLSMADVFTNR